MHLNVKIKSKSLAFSCQTIKMPLLSQHGHVSHDHDGHEEKQKPDKPLLRSPHCRFSLS